jgi:hypothetical protein
MLVRSSQGVNVFTPQALDFGYTFFGRTAQPPREALCSSAVLLESRDGENFFHSSTL